MRSLKYITAFVLCLSMVQCNRSPANIQGKWTLQSVDINGSKVEKQVLQGSYWQFEGNKYTAVMLNMQDEGTYRIKADSLFLKSETTSQRPETVYIIAESDSTLLNLSSGTNGNITKMGLQKWLHRNDNR